MYGYGRLVSKTKENVEFGDARASKGGGLFLGETCLKNSER